MEVGDPAGEPVVACFLEMGCGVQSVLSLSPSSLSQVSLDGEALRKTIEFPCAPVMIGTQRNLRRGLGRYKDFAVCLRVGEVVECGADAVEAHLAGDQWGDVDLALGDHAQ